MHSKLIFLFISTSYCLLGQQAIVNVPSADITGKGQAFFMHEMQTRFQNPDRYWYGTNFFAYGVGKNTEIAVTTYNAGGPSVMNQNVGVGFKTGVPIQAKSKPAWHQQFTFGTMALFNYKGMGVGNFSYAHYSWRLPKSRTRFTTGGWFATEQLVKKNTGNVLLGVEHPIGRRVILMAEWFAGTHDFGFVVPGILFHPTPRQMIVAGYKIANNPANGKNGFVFEYGFVLGKKEGGDDHH